MGYCSFESMTRAEQEANFRSIYAGLNPQQQKAVDTIEGPVMVIAGPGTGKTQILSARIGKILLETDALPENILCLTYTDAGVVAMRKRLQQFIGPDAYKVNIYTFHAFCNDIIQENLSLFEKNTLDPISDLERIALFKELINAFPKNHPLKRYRGDVYYEISHLQNLFSTMKREGWSSQQIETAIDAYINDLPNRDEFVYKKKYRDKQVGDLKEDKINEEKERMEKLRAAVKEFDRFQELMRRRNRYDFDDMINWVIRAFETNSSLLSRYQEQFQYILVDEYQDTSGTQNKLVQLLISFWDAPNVFVVGDDDQSIYRFQGANVANMLSFAQQYQKDLLTVVLTQNYRSTQPILDASKTIIDKNEERLVKQMPGLSKELASANTKINHLTHTPKLVLYNNQHEEMMGITQAIEQLLQQGIPPGKIAVIYKENKYGEELARYFRLKQIPFYSKRNVNILEQPLGRQLVLMLQFLAAEHDTPYGGDEMLFEILHFEWFKAKPMDIARLSVEVAAKQFSDQKTSLRELLYTKAQQPAKDLFSQALDPALKQASAVLENLIAAVPNNTLQQLFELVIQQTGVLKHIMQHAEKHWLLRILTGLFDFIKEETRRNPMLSLAQLVSILELMEEEDLPLPLVQINGNDSGVNLLTAHGSKGLEFQYVFFAGCNAGAWEKKKKPGSGFRLPDTLLGTSVSSAQADAEELRRLFYVALTRAEQSLTLSFSRFNTEGKEIEPSMFVAELQDQHGYTPETIVLPTATLDTFRALQFMEQARPEISAAEEAFVAPLLDKFVMNVTALNNYLKCPLNFYFNNLVRVPSGKSEATEFGSAVHHALQKLFENMQQHNNVFADKTAFIEDFDWYMHRHRENFTKEQFDRRIEYGHEVLSNYYDTYINQWNKIVAVERSIRNVVVKGVPIKGKLDKLEFNGKQVNVVDYKTGDIDKAKNKLKPPHEKDPNGGDYWRQAVFYKLLVDNYQQKDWQVVSTEFDFIEPDKKKQYQKAKVVITPEDTTTVSEQIVTVWNKIQAREFYTGCGKKDCDWCNFVKTNELAIALHDAQEPDAETD